MEKDPLFQILGFGVSLEMLLAVLALFLTMYQARQSRKHNRLSLKPILHWESDRTRNGNELTVCFDLKNHGLGPAVISKVEIFWQGRGFPTDTPDPVTQLMKAVIGAHFSHHVQRQHVPAAKAVMRPQEEIRVASIFFESLNETLDATLFEIFEGLRIVVYYESVYSVRDFYDTDEKLPLGIIDRVLRPIRAMFRNVQIGQRSKRLLS